MRPKCHYNSMTLLYMWTFNFKTIFIEIQLHCWGPLSFKIFIEIQWQHCCDPLSFKIFIEGRLVTLISFQ